MNLYSAFYMRKKSSPGFNQVAFVRAAVSVFVCSVFFTPAALAQIANVESVARSTRCEMVAATARTRQIDRPLDIGYAFVCDGNRSTVADSLWERVAKDPQLIITLSRYAAVYPSASVLRKVAVSADSAPTWQQRQAAVRVLFSAIDPGMMLAPQPVEENKFEFALISISDASGVTSPSLKATSLQLVRQLASSARFADVKDITTAYLRMFSLDR